MGVAFPEGAGCKWMARSYITQNEHGCGVPCSSPKDVTSAFSVVTTAAITPGNSRNDYFGNKLFEVQSW